MFNLEYLRGYEAAYDEMYAVLVDPEKHKATCKRCRGCDVIKTVSDLFIKQLAAWVSLEEVPAEEAYTN